MEGLQLMADLRGCACDAALLADAERLRAHCLAAVERAGLHAVAELFHRYAAPGAAPQGVTGVVLLAESHVAVHTWPELGAVTLDVYVCNVGADNSAKARALVDDLQHAFAPRDAVHHVQRRGTLALPHCD